MDFKKPVTLLMTALDSAKDIRLIKDGQLDDAAVEGTGHNFGGGG